jgi:protocatechuate 3,4-dioxygenase beta subunit
MARLVSLFLFCMTVFSRMIAPPADSSITPQVQPEDKGKISGTVLNSADGTPLKKVRVTLLQLKDRRAAEPESVTDSAGRYQIERIDPGQYRLFAERNGFVSQTYGGKQAQRGGGVTISLSRGQTRDDLNFKLTPQSVIVGKVTDQDGEPIDEASVESLRYSYVEGKRKLIFEETATTNDLGEYRMFGLAPGKCYVKASRPISNDWEPVPISNGKPEEEFTPSYYLNATSPEDAAQVTLSPGAVIQVNLTLRKIRTYRIRGRAINARTGASALDAQITLLPDTPNAPSWDMERYAQVQDRKGSWEFQGVERGSYVVIGDQFSNATGRETARTHIDVGGRNVEKVELTLTPAIELSGRLSAEGRFEHKGLPLDVYLKGNDRMGTGSGNISGQVNDDGTFKLLGVTQDSYSVRLLNLPENWYVKSVRYGGNDVTYNPIDFTEGLTSGELTLTISPDAGQLEGVVLNTAQEPAAGATVVVVPEAHRDQTQLFRTANSDEAGHYVIKGITPGDYKVFAWEAVEPFSYEDPEFLKPYEANGESVSIGEGARANKTLKLIPASKEDGQT